MLVTKKQLFAFVLTLLLCLGLAYGTEAQTLNTGLQYGNATGLASQDIRVTIVRIIRIILGFLGVIGVCLVMYAGFVWMTAKGEEEKIEQAKKILKNGVIGLIIILSAFAIVSFILSRLLGATGLNGQDGNGNGNGGSGVNGLGNGIIKSVYPEPFQTDVPRNTSIIVTFREKMQAASICFPVNTNGVCAPGAKILPDSVKIFKTSDGIGGVNIENTTVASNDNTTFVFRPIGLPVANVTVNLTKKIKKESGQDAFGLTDFRWTFDVSSRIDLDSPKIVAVNQGGIFPSVDNEKDTVASTQPATAATGTITVNGQPLAQRTASAKAVETAGSVKGSIEGTNSCSEGTVSMSIVSIGSVIKARTSFYQSGITSPVDLPIVNNRVTITPCSITLVFAGIITVGNSWRIDVQPAQAADTLTAGSKIYSFVSGTTAANQISIGTTLDRTADNIALAIGTNHPELTAVAVGPKVNFSAKTRGSSGSTIELSTRSAFLSSTGMHGGSDATTTFTVNGVPDQPKNTIIQINFNEPINPLTIAGASTDLEGRLQVVNNDGGAEANGISCTKNDECKSYKCSAGHCVGNQLAGKFVVSNQYKTAEFIPTDNKCGVNGCGESIYCLPANAEIRVEAKAAPLSVCTRDSDCLQSPYNSCVQGVCHDNVLNKNFPTAADLSGIVDVASNSFDGNRNGNPQGRVETWNENLDDQINASRGDNYRWSFWVSDRLDLTAPRLLSTTVPNNQGGVGLTKEIEAVFSKLMMSSSLTTGTVTIDNGIKQVTHNLINLWSLANDPIGYWVQKVERDSDNDHVPDQTVAIIKHGNFNSQTSYEAQIGSGVKDRYQNCYKPSAGPGCNANSISPSCCRDANGDLMPTNLLKPGSGNCP